jgi:hypothetical protein
MFQLFILLSLHNLYNMFNKCFEINSVVVQNTFRLFIVF